MIAAPTFSQIKGQVNAVLQRSNGSKVIGIHAQGRWTGDRLQFDGTQKYLIEQCDSPLAVRIALQQAQQEPDKTKGQDHIIRVLITTLSENDLAEDILIRLAKQRLFTIDPWQIVKSLFRATSLDPRLIEHRWIPEVLMDWMPAYRYAPVMGGFLDAEVIWPLLLKHGFYLKADRPELTTLLEWSVEEENVQRYQHANEEFRAAAVEWLAGLIGPTVKAILHCVAQNELPDALPLGLAAEVIYHPETHGKLDKAVGKLEERFLNGTAFPQPIMQTWSLAARQTLNGLPATYLSTVVQRSDAILKEISADQFAHLSSISEQGFNQHLTQLSKYLIAVVKKPTQVNLTRLKQVYTKVEQHQQLLDAANQRRLQRMQMSLRLAQWLVNYQASPIPAPKALEEAISYHIQDGGFLDWARLTLPMAEPHRELAKAFGKLFDAVTEIRESQSYQFAKLLQDWTAIGSMRKSFTLIENILETVISPLAATHPILLIVMDGMSLAVCNELLSDLEQQNWHLLAPKDASQLSIQAGLAAIPSITEVSRASLLCGQIKKGTQSKEKPGFTKHPALLQHCKRNAPPLLFHKDALQSCEASVLSNELHGAIGSKTNRVIGLVINAVDDLLSKGEQVDIAWTCDRIKVLHPILEAARTAGRVVIITSDHGHVLHHGSKYQPPKQSERWRKDNGKPKDNELRLEGDRVIAPGGNSVIAPWSEKIRYCTNKKNGYHGGINPQEMIVPIAALASYDTHFENWEITDISFPNWWTISHINTKTEVAAPEEVAALEKANQSEQMNLGPLFNLSSG